MQNSEKVIRYWRKSLSDESYAHVVVGEGTHDGFLLPEGTAGQWKVSPEILSGIGHPEGGSYLLGIGALSRVTGREGMRSILPVLIVPIEVNRRGEIAPDFEAGGPWLQRALFFQPFRFANSEAVEWKISTYPLLGDAGDKSVQDLPWEHRWQVAMPMVDKLLKTVTGGVNGWTRDNGESVIADLTGKLPEGWVAERAVFFIPLQAYEINRTSMTGPLLTAYDHLTEVMLNGRPPRTLQRFLSVGGEGDRPKVPVDAQDRLAAVRAHLGQVGDQFPMDEDQRRAAQTAAVMEEGSILAVEGPPGTGKTALIQALVADVVVQATLRNPEIPGKVLISSTNNQAIENVLETFARAGGHKRENAILTQRWLPGIGSIGLHLAAYSRVADSEMTSWKWPTYHPARNAVTSLSQLREDHISGSAWNTFRMFYAKQYGDKPEDADSAARELLRRVRELAEQLREHANGLQEAQSVLDQAWYLHEKKGYAIGIENEWRARLRQAKAAYDALHAEEQSPGFRLKQVLPGQKRKWEETREARLRAAGVPVPFGEALDWMRQLAKETKEAGAITAALQPYLPDGETDLESLGRDASQWASLRAKDEAADTTVRVQLFWTALHYWEAKWLSEMAKRHVTNKGLIPAWDYATDNQSAIEGWNLRFMAFPVMVSTLYSAPKFFANKSREPLTEMVDLVVIDEAGQVSPELAGPTVALGRKLVVLGDEAQIEPIWGVPEEVDRENIAQFHLSAIDYETLKTQGVTAYGTSAQARAYATDNTGHYRAQKDGKKAGPGLSLTHHRRSCEPIMQIYNRLSYQGRLRCERGLNDKAIAAGLQPLQYQHVPGFSRRAGESRENLFEASMVALWVASWRSRLLDIYAADDLSGIVGIVTPYAAQAVAIRKALRERSIPDAITVGTVHKLQGAERAVVLVSPAVGYGDSVSFFDGAANILNVATSRAKDALVLIGNLDQTPSAPTTYSRMVSSMIASGQRIPLPATEIPADRLVVPGINDAEYCPGNRVVPQIGEMIAGIAATRIEITLSEPEDLDAWAEGGPLHTAVAQAMEQRQAEVTILGRPDWDVKERVRFARTEQVAYQLCFSPFSGARITAGSRNFTCMAAGDRWSMSDPGPWTFFCGEKVRRTWTKPTVEGAA
jgi:hypothetical protein